MLSRYSNILNVIVVSFHWYWYSLAVLISYATILALTKRINNTIILSFNANLFLCVWRTKKIIIYSSLVYNNISIGCRYRDYVSWHQIFRNLAVWVIFYLILFIKHIFTYIIHTLHIYYLHIHFLSNFCLQSMKMIATRLFLIILP